MRQAVDGGFLVSPTKSFLLEQCKTSKKKNSSLRDIKYIHLTDSHIRTLGYIQSCHFLTVCILHSNYLTRFSALENCPYLKRLDLHSNQIVKLPDEDFWREMKNLMVLNLHDNGIGKLEHVQSLSKCCNLTALTLHDTPLSLKPNYRHHVVNSIWSLKALDHHVIADDEIIEDAMFSKRFSAMNPLMYIDLCPKETQSTHEKTLEMELEIIRKIMSNINHRLAHGSPVIVIQRWVRGHLCRKKLNISYLEVTQKMKKLNAVAHGSYSDSQGGETFCLDYDTYLKNRRPGSKTPSASTTRRADTPSSKVVAADDFKADDFEMKLPPELHINLAKLEENALRVIGQGGFPEQGITIHVQRDSSLPVRSLFSHSVKLSFEKDARESKQLPPSLKRIQQQRAKDTVVHEIPSYPVFVSKTQEAGVQCEEDPEIPNHEWRIHKKKIKVDGGKPALAELDPVHDHVIATREAGRDVREAIEYWHDQEVMKSKPSVVKPKPATKLKDNVSLATLMAVTKAYRDRDRTDNIAMKVDRVVRIQQERMQSKEIVAAFKEEKRSLVLSQRQEDRLKFAEATQQAEISKAAYAEYARERKERSVQRHFKRHKDLIFVTDFGNQHVSVSNALIRHDRQAAKDDLVNEKIDVTNAIKMQLSEQEELVRRYMEHKQLVNQLNASKEKSKVDARIAQDTNNRVMQSRQRVARLKAKKAGVQSYQHSLPPTSNPAAWTASRATGDEDGSPTLAGRHLASSFSDLRDRKMMDVLPNLIATKSSLAVLPPRHPICL